MKRLSQIGWACACVALLTPATARAEPVSVSATAYEPSFVHYAVDRENAREAPERGTSLFALCHRCATPHAAPFIPSANLSRVSSGENGGFGIDFKGGFSASFGGAFVFPVPAMSSTTPGSDSTPGSSTPSITIPIPSAGGGSSSSGAPAAGSAPAAGGGASAGLAAVVVGGGGSVPTTNHIAGSVATTGKTAFAKGESLAATPEPATLLLLGVGLIALAGRTWRQFS